MQAGAPVAPVPALDELGQIRTRTMPRGDKSAYTGKQKRKAQHIEQGYEDRGVPKDEAEARAWATVNKETGGGNVSEPSLRIDVVELRGLDQGLDDGGALAAAVGATEQPRLGTERHAAQRALGSVVGDADAAIVEEAGGRQEYCGLRQSIPSSGQASCEAVSESAPSVAEGQMNRPFSSRLA